MSLFANENDEESGEDFDSPSPGESTRLLSSLLREQVQERRHPSQKKTRMADDDEEESEDFPFNESTRLLSSRLREQVQERRHPSQKKRRTSKWTVAVVLPMIAACGFAMSAYLLFGQVTPESEQEEVKFIGEDVFQYKSKFESELATPEIELEGRSHEGKSHHSDSDDMNQWQPQPATRRCKWVVDVFTESDAGKSHHYLRKQYAVQAESFNVFYRATARIFWLDFSAGNWSHGCLANIDNATLYDGTPLEPKSMWTWVTGDQHLSNFGAWHNRHGDLVFSVNDFDEAAIYDFHVDVLRIAVSICNHAYTNGLSAHHIKDALKAFTDMYIKTVISYVGGDREMLFEITSQTAKGKLRQFLLKSELINSAHKQMHKFTEVDASGSRRFSKNNETRLVAVSPTLEGKIRAAFTAEHYGATMLKMGWHVHVWDEDYFRVLDVAARLGSGVGSYGVDRYYVLLNGEDNLLHHNSQDKNSVILDIKFEPTPAVKYVLDENDAAWYSVLFTNEAARAVEAQRRLTSYTDPFTGWIIVDGEALVVRQRSPWKDSPDLNKLTDPDDFIQFMEQIAVATATSHARGTVGKSPGQFKHVIASILGHKANRKAWGKSVRKIAQNYHEQVMLDFGCFKEFVDANYS
jgi:uncharacterized protein (DUF2252 family)